MNEGLDALPDDVRAILRAERARTEVPDEARRRLADRLAGSVPGFEPPHAPEPTGTPPSGAGAFTAPLTTKALLVLLALAAGGAAALKGGEDRSSVEARAKATAAAAQESASHAKPVVVEEPVVARAEPEPGPAADVTAPKVAPLALQVPPSLTKAASLREERRLLDLARDAIVRGEPGEALGPTATHAARFPHGVLAEERDALRIRALARLGRLGEARDLLAHLRTTHPHSFLIEGASDDVRTIP